MLDKGSNTAVRKISLFKVVQKSCQLECVKLNTLRKLSALITRLGGLVS